MRTLIKEDLNQGRGPGLLPLLFQGVWKEKLLSTEGSGASLLCLVTAGPFLTFFIKKGLIYKKEIFCKIENQIRIIINYFQNQGVRI
jgi:hypothetical protein